MTNLTVVDYCDFYFCTLQEIAIPPQRGGKLVVVTHGSQRHAVFSPRGLSAYHANLVERFLRQQGLKGRYNKRGDMFHFDSAEWEVEGGAHWTLDDRTGILNLFGRSQAYGTLHLPRLAEELAAANHFRVVAFPGGQYVGTGA